MMFYVIHQLILIQFMCLLELGLRVKKLLNIKEKELRESKEWIDKLYVYKLLPADHLVNLTQTKNERK